MFVAEAQPEDPTEHPAFADADAPRPRIVGFASCGPAGRNTREYSGELGTLYLLASHQRRGLGSAFVHRVVERLAQAGRNSLFVWGARDNPSRGLYEALGGTLVRERRGALFGLPFDEVGYGWDDTTDLLTRLRTR